MSIPPALGRMAFLWAVPLASVNEGKKAQARPRDRMAGMRYMNPQPQKAPKGKQKWQPIR